MIDTKIMRNYHHIDILTVFIKKGHGSMIN